MLRSGDLRAILREPIRSIRFAAVTASAASNPPILCPSIGRVGSTMLWKALVQSRAQALLGNYRPGDWSRISRMAWDLAGQHFDSGTICKTHDFPYELNLEQPLRIVFLFGRPSDVILSVLRCHREMGAVWTEDHLRHMHARGQFEDIIDHDALRLEEQIEAWLSLRGADVLCLNYGALWEHARMLDSFVGFSVTLPDRIERQFDDIASETVRRVRQTYAHLDGRIAKLPSFQLVRKEP